jgi:hypothetical protein
MSPQRSPPRNNIGQHSRVASRMFYLRVLFHNYYAAGCSLLKPAPASVAVWCTNKDLTTALYFFAALGPGRVVAKQACRWKVRRTSSRHGKFRLGEWGTTTVGRKLTPPPPPQRPPDEQTKLFLRILAHRQACLAGHKVSASLSDVTVRGGQGGARRLMHYRFPPLPEPPLAGHQRVYL